MPFTLFNVLCVRFDAIFVQFQRLFITLEFFVSGSGSEQTLNKSINYMRLGLCVAIISLV